MIKHFLDWDVITRLKISEGKRANSTNHAKIHESIKKVNKLGLSCAKLRLA